MAQKVEKKLSLAPPRAKMHIRNEEGAKVSRAAFSHDVHLMFDFCRVSVNLKVSLLRLNDRPSQDCHSKHLWHASMTVSAVAAASFCGTAFVFHIVSIII